MDGEKKSQENWAELLPHLFPEFKLELNVTEKTEHDLVLPTLIT